MLDNPCLSIAQCSYVCTYLYATFTSGKMPVTVRGILSGGSRAAIHDTHIHMMLQQGDFKRPSCSYQAEQMQAIPPCAPLAQFAVIVPEKPPQQGWDRKRWH